MAHEIHWQGRLFEDRTELGTFRLVVLDHPTNGNFAIQKLRTIKSVVETVYIWEDVKPIADEGYYKILSLVMKEVLRAIYKDYMEHKSEEPVDG